MHASSHAANPFGMLIDPAAIQKALEGSQRLESLNRRICRPLDRVMPAKSGEAERERADHDAAMDAQASDDTDD
jgi:hypothetical protein